jgi:hypothetical protein
MKTKQSVGNGIMDLSCCDYADAGPEEVVDALVLILANIIVVEKGHESEGLKAVQHDLAECLAQLITRTKAVH